MRFGPTKISIMACRAVCKCGPEAVGPDGHYARNLVNFWSSVGCTASPYATGLPPRYFGALLGSRQVRTGRHVLWIEAMADRILPVFGRAYLQ